MKTLICQEAFKEENIHEVDNMNLKRREADMICRLCRRAMC